MSVRAITYTCNERAGTSTSIVEGLATDSCRHGSKGRVWRVGIASEYALSLS